MNDPTPDDLRSAAEVLEAEWGGGFYDQTVGGNDDGIGVPVAEQVAAMRLEADRLDESLERWANRFSARPARPMGSCGRTCRGPGPLCFECPKP